MSTQNFSIFFGVKLGNFTNNEFFLYVTSTQPYHQKLENKDKKELLHRGFCGFGQAKFPDDGLVLGSRQFSILPQLPT